jgi:hypothetical protein
VFERAQDIFKHIRWLVFTWRPRTRARLARYRRAWRYAANGLSADDAQMVLVDCRYAAGWHSLLTLTVESTLEQALEQFEDHPDLPRLIADGCARVGRKWESYGDQLYEAQRWAVDEARRYADEDGIFLVALDGDAER